MYSFIEQKLVKTQSVISLWKITLRKLHSVRRKQSLTQQFVSLQYLVMINKLWLPD